jgi:hypothetical protein
MQHSVIPEKEINPFKIGPFLLCYHEELMLEDSLYKNLHDDLKARYNFFITNTGNNIAKDKYLQNKLNSFVDLYENHCYIFSAKTAEFFYDDVNTILAEYLAHGKSLSHLVIIKTDDTPINLSRIDNRVKMFDITLEYNRTFHRIARYFISVTDDSFIRFDLQEYFGIQSIVQVCNFVDSKIFDLFSHNPHELMRIDRRVFEELIAEIFSRQGFVVELTKRTRDGGYDVLAVHEKDILVKYLIECKRPDIGKKIGIRPVRELYAVKVAERATKAILATTASFTKDAALFFDEHKWEIEGKDFNDIMEWIRFYSQPR